MSWLRKNILTICAAILLLLTVLYGCFFLVCKEPVRDMLVDFVQRPVQIEIDLVDDIDDMRYETERQKRKFFKSVGCRYCNHMEINCKGHALPDPKETEYYKTASNNIIEWSKKYENDVRGKMLAPMYVQWVSPKVGHGVFAADGIRAGDFIGVYAGDIRLMLSGNDQEKEDVDYAWDYSCKGPGEDRFIIDGKHCGNELRFINHAQSPNTTMIYVIADDVLYVCYIAKKDIAINQQLTVSYGNSYWTTRNVKPEDC